MRKGISFFVAFVLYRFMFFLFALSFSPPASSLRISSTPLDVKWPDWCIKGTTFKYEYQNMFRSWTKAEKEVTVNRRVGKKCEVRYDAGHLLYGEKMIDSSARIDELTTICQKILYSLNKSPESLRGSDRGFKSCDSALPKVDSEGNPESCCFNFKGVTLNSPIVFNPDMLREVRPSLLSTQRKLITEVLNARKIDDRGSVGDYQSDKYSVKYLLNAAKWDITVKYKGFESKIGLWQLVGEGIPDTNLIQSLETNVCIQGPQIFKSDDESARGTIIFAMHYSTEEKVTHCLFNLYYSSGGEFKMTDSLPLSDLVTNAENSSINFVKTLIKTAGNPSNRKQADSERLEMCKILVSGIQQSSVINGKYVGARPMAPPTFDFDSCYFEFEDFKFEKHLVGSERWGLKLKQEEVATGRNLAEDCKAVTDDRFNNRYKFERFIIGQGCVFIDKKNTEAETKNTKVEKVVDNSFVTFKSWRGANKELIEAMMTDTAIDRGMDIQCPGTSNEADIKCSDLTGLDPPLHASGTSGGFKLRLNRIFYQTDQGREVLRINYTRTAAEAVRSVCKASVPENMAYWLGINYKLSSNGRHCGVIDGANVIFSWPVRAGKGLEVNSGDLPGQLTV